MSSADPGNGHDVTGRCCTTRKRLATYAESVSVALAAGLAPVPWKSENAARLVDEHRAGQVDRQRRRPRLPPPSIASSITFVVGRVDRQRERAVPAHGVARDGKALFRRLRAMTKAIGPNHSLRYAARSAASSLTISGVRTVAPGYAGWAMACVSSTTVPRERAASSRRATPSFCSAPSTSTARAGSPSSFCTPSTMAATTWSNGSRTLRGGDAVLGNVDVLRRRAHLSGVEREEKAMLRATP